VPAIVLEDRSSSLRGGSVHVARAMVNHTHTHTRRTHALSTDVRDDSLERLAGSTPLRPWDGSAMALSRQDTAASSSGQRHAHGPGRRRTSRCDERQGSTPQQQARDSTTRACTHVIAVLGDEMHVTPRNAHTSAARFATSHGPAVIPVHDAPPVAANRSATAPRSAAVTEHLAVPPADVAPSRHGSPSALEEPSKQ
jgi:hypothetical protein